MSYSFRKTRRTIATILGMEVDSPGAGDLWPYPEDDTPTHALHPGYPEATPPVRLPGGECIQLRPLGRSDGQRWSQLRLRDEEVLRPVEPTLPEPWDQAHSTAGWRRFYSPIRYMAKHGEIVPLAIECDGLFVGQVTIGGISHGTGSECWIGYWVAEDMTGRGIATAACALGTDLAFSRVGIHRVTATFLPENLASRAVLEHCGFRQEGYLRRNLHIDGRWRDHYLHALVRDDFAESVVERLERHNRLTRM